MIGHISARYQRERVQKEAAQERATSLEMFGEFCFRQEQRIDHRRATELRQYRVDELNAVADQELLELVAMMESKVNREGESQFEYDVIPTANMMHLCDFEFRR